MLKRWLEFKSNGNSSSVNGRNGSAEHAAASPEPQESGRPPRPSTFAGEEESALPSEQRVDSEEIYRSACARTPGLAFGIVKVIEMTQSQHLAGLSPEAKRCAVSMALEAVGVQMEDLLQDALSRQRALNDSEKDHQERLRRFEEMKCDENRRLQAELDALTADYMARLQANLDEVAREQDKFREWQRTKQQHTQQLADAAAFCVPEGMGSHGGNLTAMLERACAARR